jgi:predicted PurR-regulated permease PerM
MRAIFGIIALLLALLIVGTLVKKQVAVQTQPLPSLQTPNAATSSNTPAVAPTNQREQAQQLQQQIKQTLDQQMQAPRAMPDEPK